MNNVVLKPCPFCGGEAITEGRKTIGNYKSDREYSYVNWIVRCTNRECFMSGLRMSAFLNEFLTEEEAIDAWNRRVGEEDKILEEQNVMLSRLLELLEVKE